MTATTTEARSFADLRAGRRPSHPGRVCSVRRIRAKLDDESRAVLDAALAADPDDEPSTGIAEDLRAVGFEVSGTTIARHRRGECKCPREGDQ